LAEYYASEGADDQIMVEFPKGTYASRSTRVPTGRGEAMRLLLMRRQQLEVSDRDTRSGIFTIVALSVVLASVVAVATTFISLNK